MLIKTLQAHDRKIKLCIIKQQLIENQISQKECNRRSKEQSWEKNLPSCSKEIMIVDIIQIHKQGHEILNHTNQSKTKSQTNKN